MKSNAAIAASPMTATKPAVAEPSAAHTSATGKIWIDLDNTPHVPFFRPIIRELRAHGVSVVVTARDAFQVCELAVEMGVAHVKIGRHCGKSSIRKLVGLAFRAGQLFPIAFREKPLLALSHGARSQILIANLLRIPTVMIDDYEHSRHVPLAKPKWVILPEVLASRATYCAQARLRSYPGIKEDVYSDDFTPDDELGKKLGVRGGQIVVTIRPPATVAHYHNPESEELLAHLLERVRADEQVTAILLPRTKDQGRELQAQYPQCFATGRVIIPSAVVDGLKLVWFSDLVVSGGGTMNREAAALGVPVYSIFRGPTGAVDQWLNEQGRLEFIRNKDEVYRRIRIERRPRGQPKEGQRPALRELVRRIEDILKDESCHK